MKILFVVPSLSDAGAGVTESARMLALELEEMPDVEVHVLGLAMAGGRLDWGQLRCTDLSAGLFGFSAGVTAACRQANPDIIHIHGLWLGLGTQVAHWAARQGIPYVVSPHGMLDAWALRNSRWKKRIYGLLLENRVFRRAVAFHGLTVSEQLAVEQVCPGKRFRVLPNGIHLPEMKPDVTGCEDRPRLLFLSRLHPKKGVLELIRAWGELLESGRLKRDWVLEIAGSGDPDYEQELRAASKDWQGDRILFSGHVQGESKAKCFQTAEAFVLPSKSEGMPVAVLEAWSYHVPVAMTAECYLEEAFGAGAAHQIVLGEKLSEGLLQFCNQTPEEMRGLGEQGYKYVSDRYLWGELAGRFKEWYGELVSK